MHPAGTATAAAEDHLAEKDVQHSDAPVPHRPGWRDLWEGESGTSDVEYVLLLTLVVLPLMIVPPLLIKGNIWFFERASAWLSLPYP